MSYQVITVTLNPAIDRTYVVEGLQTGALNRATTVRWDAGGKGINVARALKQFEVSTLATGFIAGSQGDALVNKLNEEQIPNDFFKVSGETRVNIKLLDPNTGLTTEVNEAGFEVNEVIIEAFLSKLDQRVKGASFLILSGSLPVGCPKDIYARIIERYRGTSLRIALDADHEALVNGVAARPFALKPNQFELNKLIQTPIENESEIGKEAEKLQRSGIEPVSY
ncbi:MAG: hexose kinase, partial [Clostridia bacterium]|nr:hexose kinase [Clostridia bacterium]